MSNIFHDLKAFIIPTKLSEYETAYYSRLIDQHGGSVCQNQKDSTLILTVLKSLPRIKRNMKTHQIPVVDIQWLIECDKANELLSLGSYTLINGSREQLTPGQMVQPPSVEILNRDFSKLPPEELLFDDIATDLRHTLEADSSDDEQEKDIDLDKTFINTKYECFHPTPDIPKYNKRLVSLLSILERKRTLDNEKKRSLSYRHAISAIKAYPREIQSSKEAAKIIGVGKKMAEKIRDYLKTGTIEEAEQLRSNEKFRVLSLFSSVFGVGVVTANIWWNLGYRTLQEVLDKAKISSGVRIGINLLLDFNQSMSREDVEEIIEIVKKELQDIDKDAFITPVGGYRRGKLKNGDVDLLISSDRSVHGLLDKFLERLIDRGYLKHKLWSSSEFKETQNGKGYHNRRIMDNFEKCFCAFLQPSTGLNRQVDLIVVPSEELPMAILGWTGSRQFERSIRDYAKKEKQMSVNNQSIHKIIHGSKRRLVVKSERESFEIIGVPYIEPEFRNC